MNSVILEIGIRVPRLTFVQRPYFSLGCCYLDIRAILCVWFVCSILRLVTVSDRLDRLITSSVITFAFTGVLLLSICRIYPTYFSPVSTDLQYSTIPLDDRRQPHASREPSPERIGSGTTINPRTQRILFILVIFALCLRLEFLRWTLKEIQCTWSGIEVHRTVALAEKAWLIWVGCWTIHTSNMGLLADSMEAS